MIIPTLVILAILTFLTSIPIPVDEYATTKFVFRLMTFSFMGCAIIFATITGIASHQTTFLKANSIPVSTHSITKHTLSTNQDHIFTLEDGTTYTVPDSDLTTSYTTYPSNTLTICQGVVDMNPYLPVSYPVEDKFYEFTPTHN